MATLARTRRVAPRLAILFLSAPPPGARVTPSLFVRALSSRALSGLSGGGGGVDPFRTIIPIEPRRCPPSPPLLTYADKLFFVGSCFSDNVGQLASSSKFAVLRNPFGVQYNGSSIARCLRRIADGEPYRLDELGCHPTSGLGHSLDHHSRYNGPNRDEVLEAINADLCKARDFLADCTQAYVTLGSAYVFDAVDPSLHRPLKAVANCHKLPPRMFTRRLQSVEEIRDALLSCRRSLADMNPDVAVTFTVSPVRHWKDGPVNNSRSKAHLLAAAHDAVEAINSGSAGGGIGEGSEEEDNGSADSSSSGAPEGQTWNSNIRRAEYFPSYEILMDELRDYRFFDDDMLHPSGVAVNYIWERLLDGHFDREGSTKSGARGRGGGGGGGGVDEVMERVRAVERALAHRPFDPEGEAHRTFLRRQLEEMDRLERDVPTMCYQREREEVEMRLCR